MRRPGRDRVIFASAGSDNHVIRAARNEDMKRRAFAHFTLDENLTALPQYDLVRDGKRPRGWTLERDPYLLETNVPGVFAVGDVRKGSVKRVASGVGEGSVAISFVHQYLSKVV